MKKLLSLVLAVVCSLQAGAAEVSVFDLQAPLRSSSRSDRPYDFALSLIDDTAQYSSNTRSADVTYITTQPEGELKTYVRKGKGVSAYLGGTEDVSLDGMTMKIVFGEDGETVWFYEMVGSADDCFGWIKGTRSGNTITVPGGQYAWYYDYGEYYTGYTVMPVVQNGADNEGSYDAYECVDGDIIFTIDDADNITLKLDDGISGYGLCRDTNNQFLVENGFNGKWLGYADLSTEFQPIEVKFNEGPGDGVEHQSYYMSYDYSVLTGSGGSRLVTVAFDGEKVYIKGLMETLPDAWLIGSITKDGIEFNSGQMVGVIQRRYVYYIGGRISGSQGWSVMAVFDMQYDAQSGEITFPDWILLNSTPDENLLYCDGLNGISMHPFEDVPVVPADPIVGDEYEPFDDLMMCSRVSFTIPPIGKDGEDIDNSLLAYEVYVDGELFTFEPDQYFTLMEPLSLVPYGFYDYYFFSPSDSYENTVLISFLNPDFKSFGARSVYLGGNEVRKSEIVTFVPPIVGTESIDSDVYPIEVLYHDLLGRIVDKDTKGILIETKVYKDGHTDSRKIIK